MGTSVYKAQPAGTKHPKVNQTPHLLLGSSSSMDRVASPQASKSRGGCRGCHALSQGGQWGSLEAELGFEKSFHSREGCICQVSVGKGQDGMNLSNAHAVVAQV